MAFKPLAGVVKEYQEKQNLKNTTKGGLVRKTNQGLLSFFLSKLLFYLTIMGVVVVGLIATTQDTKSPEKNILGYSYFIVSSDSMEKELPINSLIITKKIEPATLAIGDNITYIVNGQMIVTHQIVGIYENPDKKGIRSFQTQGINNVNPDEALVPEEDIIGKVTYVLPKTGEALKLLEKNMWWIIFFLITILFLSFFVQRHPRQK